MQWNFKITPVYRLLPNDTFVNNFFSSGELFISCFNEFKKHPNESLRDESEGHFTIAGESQAGHSNVYIGDSGVNAYVLSTAYYITEKLRKDYSGASVAIKINNPTFFALEISRKLPSVSNGIEGFCDYKKSKVQLLEKHSIKNSILQNHNFKNDPESPQMLEEILEGKELFEKEMRFKEEGEYRLIWFSDKPITEFKIISCPEAIQHCEKIGLEKSV
jgi:hypothetical protein